MARPQSFPVRLTSDQRASLEQLRTQGLPRKQQYRIDILLRADEGDTDQEIADDLGVHADTVRRARRRFAERGLDAALNDRPRPGAPPKLDGKQEAMVIALACTEAPEGRDRWSVRLLARRAVELEVVETVSRETVRRVLKKTSRSPGRSGRGACRRSAANSSGGWRTCWSCTLSRTTRRGRWSGSTRPARSCTARSTRRCRPDRVTR